MQIEELQDVRETLSQNLSSMHGSCEQLSMEIGDLREEASFWEDQYHSQEVLVSIIIMKVQCSLPSLFIYSFSIRTGNSVTPETSWITCNCSLVRTCPWPQRFTGLCPLHLFTMSSQRWRMKGKKGEVPVTVLRFFSVIMYGSTN